MSLSLVLILPRRVSQVNISILYGTKFCHSPLKSFWGQKQSFFASSIEKDFTEKIPFLCGVHMSESCSLDERQTWARRCWSCANSWESWGLRGRHQSRVQLQFLPSHRHMEATNAFFELLKRYNLGEKYFKGESVSQESCQKKEFIPFPTCFRIFDFIIAFDWGWESKALHRFLQAPPWVGICRSRAENIGPYLYFSWTSLRHRGWGSLRKRQAHLASRARFFNWMSPRPNPLRIFGRSMRCQVAGISQDFSEHPLQKNWRWILLILSIILFGVGKLTYDTEGDLKERLLLRLLFFPLKESFLSTWRVFCSIFPK